MLIKPQSLQVDLLNIELIVNKIEDLLVEFNYAFDNTERRMEILSALGLKADINEVDNILTIINDDPNLPFQRTGGISLGLWDESAWCIVVTTLNPLLFGKLTNLRKKLDLAYKSSKKNQKEVK